MVHATKFLCSRTVGRFFFSRSFGRRLLVFVDVCRWRKSISLSARDVTRESFWTQTTVNKSCKGSNKQIMRKPPRRSCSQEKRRTMTSSSSSSYKENAEEAAGLRNEVQNCSNYANGCKNRQSVGIRLKRALKDMSRCIGRNRHGTRRRKRKMRRNRWKNATKSAHFTRPIIGARTAGTSRAARTSQSATK